jgi:hypothetical protein
MDHNYKSTAQHHGLEINKVAGDDLRVFPIENARSRFAAVYILLHSVLLVSYGWLLHQKTVSPLCIAIPRFHTIPRH